MKIHELEWDDINSAHIAEHQVKPREVEELIFEDAPHYRRGRSRTLYQVYGQTAAGRYLFVVLRYLGQHRGRVITARPMTRSERRLYRQVQRGAKTHVQDEEKA
ncbi:MAG: BrnT family toxin [Candidatus Bipolaricaulota bacterium]|nr:BrnT family toxin [Candidatus Bipolaricaulota bacterium]MCS7274875.1 BrnT family toxin [Candidatus Bipolaricaulota bacterium]MDW8111154.1 BrnT family toxin [Candidatus Bipolaricaulota bacterium]MDW8329586.1 BrnT family toxin [Candidatus Bipolaricaulota bacterium]